MGLSGASNNRKGLSLGRESADQIAGPGLPQFVGSHVPNPCMSILAPRPV